MNLLIEARQKLEALLNRQAALLEASIKEGRAITAEEEAELEKLAAEQSDTQKVIERLTTVYDSRAKANLSTNDATQSSKRPNIEMGREEGEDEEGRFVPYESFGQQLQAVVRAARNPFAVDRHLTELNKRAAAGMSEGVGADGGFLVQVDFASNLMHSAIETGILAPLCTKLPISAGKNGIEFPVVEETSRVDGSRWGGVQVYWAAEAEAATKTKPKFSLQRLSFEKLLGLCVITDEMAEDAAFLTSFVSTAFADEFAYKIDNGIIRGTGAGQMLGILNASTLLVTASAESGQGASTIVGLNALNMFRRLLGRSMKTAVWLANQNTMAQLSTLVVTKNKSDIPLYAFADGAGRPTDTILGRPVKYIEQASSLGSVGDIILADLSSYALIMRDLKQASSIHVYFDTEQTALRFSMRINGQPLMKRSITPAQGSDTLSPFVTLSASRT